MRGPMYFFTLCILAISLHLSFSHTCNEESEFRCTEKCIPLHWHCDYDTDCEEGEDEVGCAIMKCGPEHVLCESRDQCISANWWCDGDEDCEDSSDEFQCDNATCPTATVTCRSGVKKCVLERMVCDGQKDCFDGSDEDNCGVTCPSDHVMCANDDTCIKELWICDGELDCPNGTDEVDCRPTCASDEYQCSDSKCIKTAWICDGDTDCLDGADEASCAPVKCEVTEYMCADNTCIPGEWACNGEADCEDDSDEVRCPGETGEYEETDGDGEMDTRTTKTGTTTSTTQTQTVTNTVRASTVSIAEGDDRSLNATGVLTPRCLPGRFACGNGKCIPDRWVCDRQHDCLDSSDEVDCGFMTCGPKFAQCESGQCIPTVWVCDGQPDCTDGSDESDCRKVTTTSSSPSLHGQESSSETSSSTTTSTSTTIVSSKVPMTASATHLFESHKKAIKTSTETTARDVYKMQTYTPSSGTSVKNQPLTYTAPTEKTTTMASQPSIQPTEATQKTETTGETETKRKWRNKTQRQKATRAPKYRGKVTQAPLLRKQESMLGSKVLHRKQPSIGAATRSDEDAKLMVLSMAELHIIDLRSNHVNVEKLAKEGVRAVPLALDVDVRNSKVYWTDVTFTNINVGTFSENFTLTSRQELFVSGIQKPTGLALDWIHQNLYWTDSSARTITVASLATGQQKILVDSRLQNVGGIVVDPINGWLYWASGGMDGAIEMCGTDGSYRAVLYSRGLSEPKDVALDHKTNRLYWCDEESDEIGVCFLDKKKCRILFSASNNLMMYSLDIYKKHLYWNDRAHGQIQRINRNIGKYVRNIQDDLIGPKQIVIYHSDRQPSGPNRCGEDNGGCQICLPSPKGSNSTQEYVCACPDDLYLQEDNKTCGTKDPSKPSPCFEGYELQGSRCVDVDECVTRHDACSQTCLNTLGSFSCSCQSGYKLVNDTRCQAQGEGFLMVLDFSHFKRINLTTFQHYKMALPENLNVGIAVALDFDVKRELIFWTDILRNTINVARLSRDRLKNPDVLVRYEESVGGLAYDWTHRLLFWTQDSDKGAAIKVISLKTKLVKTLLDKDLGKPRAIVVDPARGRIYWTNWAQPATIERAGMDGSHRETVVSSSIQWPNGMTIDYVDERIYWCDAYHDSVTSSTLDGSDKRVIIDKTSFDKEHMYSITVFEDYVYWTDWITETVRQMHKVTGERTYHRIDGIKPHGIKVFHKARQPHVKNRCGVDTRGCSICLPSPGIQGYTCTCPDGKQLQRDGKTCVKTNERSASCAVGYRVEKGACVDEDECTLKTCSHTCINTPGSYKCTCPSNHVLINNTQCALRDPVRAMLFVADTKHLKRVDLSTGSVTSLPVANTSTQARTTALDVDLGTRTVYWTDYRETGIYSAVLDEDLKLTRKRKLNLTGIRDPQGLAIDWVHHNLYWSDLSAHSLLVTSLATGVQKTLLGADLGYIRGLAVDPRRGWIYWASWGKKPTISRVGMDGTRREELINRGLDTPNDVAIDYQKDRLYWVDGWATKLGSCNLDGKQCKTIWLSEEKLMLFSIEVFKNSIYWTEWKNPRLRRFNLTTAAPAEVLIEGGTQPAGVVVLHPDRQPYAPNRCEKAYRGGCEICLPSPPGEEVEFRCACADGLYVQADGRSCGAIDPKWPKCEPGFYINNGTCEDVNECEMLETCSQICVNTDGGYRCECRVGYDLRDGNCIISPDAFLVLIEHVFFRRFNLTTFTSTKLGVNNRFPIERPVALDFDVANSRMFWSDLVHGSIDVATVEGTLLTDPHKLVLKDASNVHGLAYDWIHELLFWVDALPKAEAIRVRSLSTRSTRTLLSEDLGKPRAIIVHPTRGWIFWTNWAWKATIERANMDGESRKVIINTVIKWPNGITIDYDTERIYWTDAGKDSLSSCNTDGTDRRLLVVTPSPHREHLFSVTQYGDHVYWIDWLSNSLRRANKITGQNMTSYRMHTQPYDLKIFHPSRQKPGENVCGVNNGGCSHLCLPSSSVSSRSRGFHCQCPDGWLLKRDDKTCLKKKSTRRKRRFTS